MNRKELIIALKQLVIQNPKYRIVATPLASTWLTPENHPELSFSTNHPEYAEITKYLMDICDALKVGYTMSKESRRGEIFAKWEFDMTTFDDIFNKSEVTDKLLRTLLPECRIKMHYQYSSTFTGIVVGAIGDAIQLNVIKDENQMFYGEIQIRDIDDIDLEQRWISILPNAIISLTALERLRFM